MTRLGLVLCAGILAVGCSHPKRRPAEPSDPTAVMPIGFDGVRAIDGTYSPAFQATFTEGLRRRHELWKANGSEGKFPFRMLTLSSGGANGVFGAGLLCGWTESGERPEFDAVTGVSVGALLAPFAFLGSDYDTRLVDVFREMEASDIHRKKWFLAPLYDESIMHSDPLWRLIVREVDEEMLIALADAHAEGRRLYVGTTNLDSGVFVIWDIGAIATRGGKTALDLTRRVLRASAAIPLAYDPVLFRVEDEAGVETEELHVDGAVVRPLFLPIQTFDGWRAARDAGFRWAETATSLYVVCNGSLCSQWQPVQRDALNIAEKAVSTMVYKMVGDDVVNLYILTRTWDATFSFAYIPVGYEMPSTLAFKSEDSIGLSGIQVGGSMRLRP